ncbi:hypothetical protein FB451DRAFT_1165688 [Mycena latifolia]|nr:hypothetical protein FB451DRAFT_1165688 [Mycena latifolia]
MLFTKTILVLLSVAAVNAAPQLDSILDTITSDVVSVATQVTGGAGSVGGDITSGAASVGGDITSGAASVGGDITSGAAGVFQTVTSAGGHAVTVVTSVGGQAITLAASGAGVVTSFAGSQYNVATGAASPAASFIPISLSLFAGLATVLTSVYFTLLSVSLIVNGIVIPESNSDGMFCSTLSAIEQVQNSDAFKNLVDGVNATENKFDDTREFEDHKPKHSVETLEIVKSKGGHTMTVVTASPGGPAVTLAAPGHGKKTIFEGHTYTVIPTSLHPSSPHFFSSILSSMHAEASSHKTSSPHLTSSHTSSSTHAPSAMASAHIVKTTVVSGKTTATVVSVSGGPAVTLAAQGTTTVIGGSTYTVQPSATHSVSSAASASQSGSSASSVTTSKASAAANVASSASASASGSHTPNAAVAHIAGSYYSAALGATVAVVGALCGALLVL